MDAALRLPVTTRLHVDADPAPELIERVCRLLRHRGAAVAELTVRATDPGTTRLEARVELGGDVETLLRQLRRLPDVRAAATVPAERVA